MKKYSTVILIFLLCHQLLAQDSLQENSRYLGFEVDRVPLISGGYFILDGLALQAGLGFSFNKEVDANGFAVKLGVDSYLKGGKLAPFVGGFTRFDINPIAMGTAGWEGSRLTFGGHWGLNYFILNELSLAGTIGAELRFNSPKNQSSTSVFSTFTSGIQLRFFF